jgi:transcriptional regulator of acetoin/glycerol metabolism
MTSTFLSQTKVAMRELERSQQLRARLDDRARSAFDRARDQYRKHQADAPAVEGAAWRALLAVPGMTVSTAAALCDVSVATVHRRMKEARDEH